MHQDEGTSYNQLRRHNLFSIIQIHNKVLAISPLNGACIGVVVMQLATAETAEGLSMPTQP